jgi:beta-lactamase class A
LYGVRLLILVVGIGAIAGTMLSTLNPNLRNSPASPLANVVAAQDPFAQSAANSRDLASSLLSLQLNQPINPLGQDITELAGSVSDLTAGVFLVDLDTGNYLDVNGTTPFSAASMIKVPVLIAFFQEVDAGRISLDEVLTMTEADRAGGSGDMQFDAEGSQYTALETATKMIIISDNTATNMLIRRMGGIDAVNQRFQSWGLDNTHIQNLLPDLEGTNLTTPRELVELMAMVSRGDLVSLRSRDRLLDIMRRTQTSTLIPAGVGDPRATIAHKTGDIGSMVGDVGIVDMPTGQRYSIAVMVKRPHNDSRAQDLIRQINAEIYQYLLNPPTPETVPPTTPSTTPPD